jgi:hypothetical protein
MDYKTNVVFAVFTTTKNPAHIRGSIHTTHTHAVPMSLVPCSSLFYIFDVV